MKKEDSHVGFSGRVTFWKKNEKALRFAQQSTKKTVIARPAGAFSLG